MGLIVAQKSDSVFPLIPLCSEGERAVCFLSVQSQDKERR